MSTQHEEFPELTQQTQAAFQAGCRAAVVPQVALTNKDRRYLAAAGVFFDTWKEAHDFLLTQARDAVNNAKVTLKTREDYLTLIESLTEELF